MANNSPLSKRAALRQQQELEERRKRNKRIAGAGIGLAIVTVIVVLAIVIFQALGARTNSEATKDQLTPPNATANQGIAYQGVQPTDDVPHVVAWEDFQCPWCAIYEETYGETIHSLADAGKITVEFRTATFLDGKTGDNSHRAALAAAAADEVGKYIEFHDAVYANQPTEGVGFTDQQLRVEYPEAAGITGDDLKRFQELYDTRAFEDWVNASAERFTTDGIGSTPSYLVAGTVLQFSDDSGNPLIQPTEESFMAAVNEAWEAGDRNNDF